MPGFTEILQNGVTTVASAVKQLLTDENDVSKVDGLSDVHRELVKELFSNTLYSSLGEKVFKYSSDTRLQELLDKLNKKRQTTPIGSTNPKSSKIVEKSFKEELEQIQARITELEALIKDDIEDTKKKIKELGIFVASFNASIIKQLANLGSAVGDPDKTVDDPYNDTLNKFAERLALSAKSKSDLEQQKALTRENFLALQKLKDELCQIGNKLREDAKAEVIAKIQSANSQIHALISSIKKKAEQAGLNSENYTHDLVKNHTVDETNLAALNADELIERLKEVSSKSESFNKVFSEVEKGLVTRTAKIDELKKEIEQAKAQFDERYKSVVEKANQLKMFLTDLNKLNTQFDLEHSIPYTKEDTDGIVFYTEKLAELKKYHAALDETGNSVESAYQKKIKELTGEITQVKETITKVIKQTSKDYDDSSHLLGNTEASKLKKQLDDTLTLIQKNEHDKDVNGLEKHKKDLEELQASVNTLAEELNNLAAFVNPVLFARRINTLSEKSEESVTDFINKFKIFKGPDQPNERFRNFLDNYDCLSFMSQTSIKFLLNYLNANSRDAVFKAEVYAHNVLLLTKGVEDDELQKLRKLVSKLYSHGVRFDQKFWEHADFVKTLQAISKLDDFCTNFESKKLELNSKEVHQLRNFFVQSIYVLIDPKLDIAQKQQRVLQAARTNIPQPQQSGISNTLKRVIVGIFETFFPAMLAVKMKGIFKVETEITPVEDIVSELKQSAARA